MNAEDDDRVDSEVRETTKNSRAEKTLDCYSGYMVIINEWYSKNQPQLCTADGVVDAEKIRRICVNRQGLIEQAKIFKRCLMSR